VGPNDPQHAGLELDLMHEADGLQRDAAGNSGRAAKTLLKHDDLRIVLMAMRADAHMPLHQASGSISIQTIRGRVRVQAGGETYVLTVGRLLALGPNVPHDVAALEDSVFVLTTGPGAKG
jgi:quercetin dioxygenase-like cupin family protein